MEECEYQRSRNGLLRGLSDETGRHASWVHARQSARRIHERSVALGLCRFSESQRVSTLVVAPALRVLYELEGPGDRRSAAQARLVAGAAEVRGAVTCA